MALAADLRHLRPDALDVVQMATARGIGSEPRTHPARAVQRAAALDVAQMDQPVAGVLRMQHHVAQPALPAIGHGGTPDTVPVCPVAGSNSRSAPPFPVTSRRPSGRKVMAQAALKVAAAEVRKGGSCSTRRWRGPLPPVTRSSAAGVAIAAGRAGVEATGIREAVAGRGRGAIGTVPRSGAAA